MRKRVIPCYYKQENPLVRQLGDLKIAYATTQSFLIKSLLKQAEDLIIFRVGSVEKIKERIKGEINPTLEERCFFEKLKKLLN